MHYPVKAPRKLIEVALPLDVINAEAAREKSIRHGHPSTLHLWWARRPLAAARAVIFAQLVNDPGYQQGGGFKYGKNKKEAAVERQRLFKIIEDLVLWENTTNEEVLERAREEIRRSWREVCELNRDHPQAAVLFNPDKLPALQDPFAGGGAIPLEAQRLGLKAYASDLNPVAVLINKAMIEIPPLFAAHAPVGPIASDKLGERFSFPKDWPGATGLAEDICRYATWMRAEAQKRIGHLYPPVEITAEMAHERPDLQPLVGQKLTVIAWLWARAVKSPNPAFSDVDVPLASSFILCSKKGKEVYLQPIVEGDHYSFTVKLGAPPPDAEDGTKAKGRGADFRCIVSDVPISGDYIKAEGQAGRMGVKLMAMVVDGARGRIYLPPAAAIEAIAQTVKPTWKPGGNVPARLTGGTCVPYGLREWGDLFTSRQLLALTTFSDLVAEARGKVRNDAIAAGLSDDGVGIEAKVTGATAYAEAVSVYLAFCLDKNTLTNTTLATWQKDPDRLTQAFSRQSIAMTWDFAEANPLSDAGGGFRMTADAIAKVLLRLPLNCPAGSAFQHDAATLEFEDRIVSTDPPYYDNIAYADLADYFYVWLRKNLQPVYPTTFATLATPKAEELVATSYRHGGKDEAEAFFLSGMTGALRLLATQAHPSTPLTIYYAFKQSDTDAAVGTSSTGWETFLEALHRAGLQLGGTWPMRTELTGNLKKQINSLASSIILVCRKRSLDAATISRRDFLRELNAVLPEALDEMTKGAGGEHSPVAPVDLSQAIIGPGMAVFSKYAGVLEADGSPMSVRTALQLINRFLAEDDFDANTQFCLHWFEQHGWTESAFGEADVLARSKSTSVDVMRESGVLQSGSGKVRLLKWAEYPTDWDPRSDSRTPVWEALHQLIRALKQGGEAASGALLAALGGKAEAVRQLAYRLYTLCERLGQAEDARAYNELITSWTGIESAAASAPKSTDAQGVLFES
jgi:putative DNA methylase